MCGEKLDGNTKTEDMQGSPPRVRGKVQRLAYQSAEGGITPACAGKSNGEELTE